VKSTAGMGILLITFVTRMVFSGSHQILSTQGNPREYLP
jgi:hypothetical protein